jgi:hypothetical protein
MFLSSMNLCYELSVNPACAHNNKKAKLSPLIHTVCAVVNVVHNDIYAYVVAAVKKHPYNGRYVARPGGGECPHYGRWL